MKKVICRILFLFLLFGFTACAGESASVADESEQKELGYEQISAEKAKSIMDEKNEYVIIDARTEEEFAEGHIEKAILIPEYEVADHAEEKIPDKDTLSLVYCRSGRRSKIAAEELAKLGYTNVKEFGGIIDWPYEVVK